MNNKEKIAAVCLDLDRDALALPKDIAGIALEAHQDGVTSPVYDQAYAKVKKAIISGLAAQDVTSVDEELVGVAVESYLETSFMDNNIASKLAERKPIPSADVNHGDEQTGISIENFDNDVSYDLAPLNAAYSVLNTLGNSLTRQIDKIFPVTKIGNNTGYQIKHDIPFVHYNSFHTDGSVQAFDEVNIADLLNSKHEFGSLRIYPDSDNAKDGLLVDAAKIAPWEVLTMDEDRHLTRPIKFGVDIDMKGAALCDARKAKGGFDATDELDPALIIDQVYLDFDGDIVSFNLNGRSTAHKDWSQQGDVNDMVLSLKEDIVLSDQTKTIADAPLNTITIPAGHQVVVEIVADGGSNIRTSFTRVSLAALNILRIVDAAGEIVPFTDPMYATIQAEINKALLPTAASGWVPDFRLQNSNLKHLGPVIDTRKIVENYFCRVSNPVHSKRPVNRAQATTAVAALHTHNSIMYTREAIDDLIECASELSTLTQGGTAPAAGYPRTVGAGRHVLNTCYIEDTVDFLNDLDSIKHSDREADHASLLILRMNDMANKMWLRGRYVIAVEGLPAGTNKHPTMILTTSEEYAELLNRYKSLLNKKFTWEIVGLPIDKLTDTMFMTINFTKSGYHLLNFGTAIIGKDNVFATTDSRNNTTTKVLVVQPYKIRKINAPVMGVVNFENKSESFKKTYVDFKNI